jgi:SAM-dependent methyltransferase
MGVASRYQGLAGEQYFAWQQEIGALGAELNRWKFAAHVQPTDTVIDFGCGSGALLAALPCRRRLGVEPNTAARERAQRNGIETFASTVDLSDEVADVVISNHALEHTLDPFVELLQLRRVLRPGGKLVFVVPSERSTSRYNPGNIDQHLFTWTPALFGNLLTESGFRVVECRLVRHAWPPFYGTLQKYPGFRVLCWLTALVLDGRQVYAVARTAEVSESSRRPSGAGRS